jgi:hypothetical protein
MTWTQPVQRIAERLILSIVVAAPTTTIASEVERLPADRVADAG